MCTLYIQEEDKVVSVASEHLDPVVPQKGDRVSRTYDAWVVCKASIQHGVLFGCMCAIVLSSLAVKYGMCNKPVVLGRYTACCTEMVKCVHEIIRGTGFNLCMRL